MKMWFDVSGVATYMVVKLSYSLKVISWMAESEGGGDYPYFGRSLNPISTTGTMPPIHITTPL